MNLNDDGLMLNPFSYLIASAFVYFSCQFYKKQCNIANAYIIRNNNFFTHDERVVTELIFNDHNRRENSQKISQITVKDIINIKNNRVKDKTGMETSIGFILNMVEFFTLRNIAHNPRVKYGNNFHLESRGLKQIFNSKTTGSKY